MIEFCRVGRSVKVDNLGIWTSKIDQDETLDPEDMVILDQGIVSSQHLNIV